MFLSHEHAVRHAHMLWRFTRDRRHTLVERQRIGDQLRDVLREEQIAWSEILKYDKSLKKGLR